MKDMFGHELKVGDKIIRVSSNKYIRTDKQTIDGFTAKRAKCGVAHIQPSKIIRIASLES